MLRELEHHSIYNPLDYNMGKGDSAMERLASGRQGAGEKVGGGRGSRGRGEVGKRRGRGSREESSCSAHSPHEKTKNVIKCCNVPVLLIIFLLFQIFPYLPLQYVS